MLTIDAGTTRVVLTIRQTTASAAPTVSCRYRTRLAEPIITTRFQARPKTTHEFFGTGRFGGKVDIAPTPEVLGYTVSQIDIEDLQIHNPSTTVLDMRLSYINTEGQQRKIIDIQVPAGESLVWTDGSEPHVTPLGAAGGGDMLKSVYDLDDDGIVDKAERVDDGTNSKTALQIKTHLDLTDEHIDWTAASAGTIHATNYVDNDTVYSHPNHTGDVTSTGDGATVIADEAVTNAKLAHINQNEIHGRATASAGDVENLTAAQARTVLNVEDGSTADQTGAEIKTAYEAEADTNAFTDADHSKLDGIEAAADVTDAANVNAAGAVMHTDVSEADGFLLKTGSETYEAVKINRAAAVAPGATDDSASGYSVSSRWFDTTADKEYVCLDATATAADWKETTGAGGGGEANTTSDVGAGANLTKAKVGVDLPFRSIVGGTAITATENTDDVTLAVTAGSIGATQLTDEGVTNAKLAHINQNEIKGRATAAAGDVEDLTAAQVRTIINVEDGSTADQTAGEIEAIVSHDNLLDFVAGEHVDWAGDGTGTVHINNLPVGGKGEQLTVNEGETALEFGLASKYLPVRKGSAGTITKGSPVYISGYNVAGWVEVEEADANGSGTMPAIGLAFDSITNSSTDRVLLGGLLADTDTSSWSAGDGLYVSETVGTLTNTAPTASASLVQRVGTVGRAHAVNGSIIVTGAGRSNALPNLSGDVTNSGAAITIADEAVTYAKMQHVSTTDRVLGRDTAGAGDVEEIAPAAVRTMLNVEDGANAYVHPNHSGDVTSVADGAQTIAANAVTHAKYQDIAQDRVMGRVSVGSGDPEELTAAQVRTLINVADGANNYSHPNHTGDVTSTGDGATVIANSAVTFAKMQDVSGPVLVGRALASSGALSALSLANNSLLYQTDAGIYGALTAGTNSFLGRGASGDIVFATVAAARWIGRTTSGNLGQNLFSELVDELLSEQSGTVFPGTPTAGQRFYRTDLDEWFEYDDSRSKWLGHFVTCEMGKNVTGSAVFLFKHVGGLAGSSTYGASFLYDMTVVGWNTQVKTSSTCTLELRKYVFNGSQATIDTHTYTAENGNKDTDTLNYDVPKGDHLVTRCQTGTLNGGGMARVTLRRHET